MKFEVNWKELWRSLTKYMFLAILFSVAGILFIKFLSQGLSTEAIFKNFSPLGYIGLFAGIFVLCFLFAGLISILFKLAAIRIEHESIIGRNYWGRTKKIPFTSIQSLDSFSNNGINAIVVNGGDHGQVYIHENTQDLGELLKILEPYVPDKENSHA